MRYTRLGNTGLQVSRICLGMMTYGTVNWREWMLSESEARPFVQRAAEVGVNFYDTADMYSLGVSEEITGKLLGEIFPRDEVVIATKVYFNLKGDLPNAGGLSRKHIMDGVDASLRRLNTDYIDLYQIHRWDYDTPIEETMEALHDVVKAGKVRYIGASSMWAWQFSKAQYIADLNGWTRFVSMQNHYNLLYREEEREMMPLCHDMGVGCVPWSPLARGRLARPRGAETTHRAANDSFADELYGTAENSIIDAVGEVAEAHGATRAQIALAWMLTKPTVSAPIIGASKLSHLDDAVGAVEITLGEEDIAKLEAPYRPRAIVGHR